MKISYRWLNEYINLSSFGDAFKVGELLTARGIEIEDIQDLSKGFEKVVSAKILEKTQHPQADRLSLCQVSTGTGAPLEVVCGAQNMKAGDIVALAQIGADLPNGLKIVQSKIRGSTSNGMLCSLEELCLATESEGIWILPPGTELGLPVSKILGREDVVLTLKVTSNRADCLSHFGIAREIASATGLALKEPKYGPLKFVENGQSPIQIGVNDSEACPQFYGVVLDGVKVGPSPDWLIKKLEAIGSRSINNVVDATNFLMFEFGHPTHAYDADRIVGAKIVARLAEKGEKVRLLDDTEIETAGTEVVIADQTSVLGLAGVMGGGHSEVQASSTRLFLECAQFSPSLVRKASSRLQKKTEASHRFERGVDPAGLPRALSRLTSLIQELAGGEVKSATFVSSKGVTVGRERKAIEFHSRYVTEFLGMTISDVEIERIFTGLDCRVEKIGAPTQSGTQSGNPSGTQGSFKVFPPSYRLDLSLREDLAEELARSVGYDKIPSTVPALTSIPTLFSEDESAKKRDLVESAKLQMVGAGYCETVNLAFSSKKWLAEFGLSSEVKILNPLSEEHEYLVSSLLPGLVQNVIENWNHQFGSEVLSVRLFELRPTFALGAQAVAAVGELETGVAENWKLSYVASGLRNQPGLKAEDAVIDFYDFKAAFERLVQNLGVRGVRLKAFQEVVSFEGPGSRIRHLFHPGQSVGVLAGRDLVGFIGMVHPKLSASLKLRHPLWLAEVDWTALRKLMRSPVEVAQYQPYGSFPSVERDFALLVSSSVQSDQVVQSALKAAKPLAKTVRVFDIYKGKPVPEGMTSVAVRVIFLDEARSLEESEVEQASAKILQAWKKEFNAELR